MKLKKRYKNLLLIILILIIVIIIFINTLKSKSYEVEYTINNYNITENYDKDNKLYTFTISNKDIKHSFYSNIKYQRNHKLINNIDIKETENEICLIINSESISSNPLCSINNQEVDYRLTSDEMKKILNYESNDEEKETKYNNLLINNPLDYTFLVWNYKGFDVIKKDETNTIKIFDKDQYEIPLATMINKYIIIADYESEYTFNKFYIINIEDNTIDEMKIKYDISFDSYFIGTHDNSIYLVDKKNKKEYEIVPHKKKMRLVGSVNKKGVIFNEGHFEKININKLIADELTFKENLLYQYEIKDNILYQIINDSSMQVSNLNVKDIISINKDIVLYLSEDNLYLYDNEHGETKIMSNFEWNFNYKNLIFLYNS